jgi:hypothetical protein
VKKFKVWYISVPGMYEQYDGYIEVSANDQDQALERAWVSLRRAFPERVRAMWRVEKIELSDSE